MAAVAVIARTTVIFSALITSKFIAAVAVRLVGCECCGSDTSNDVAAHAGIIVVCCLASEDNCWQ